MILVNNIHGNDVANIAKTRFVSSKMADYLTENLETEPHSFVEEEVAFYTTSINKNVCIRETKFMSGTLHHSHNGKNVLSRTPRVLGKSDVTSGSIPATGFPLMRPTFWLGPSMVKLLVGPRIEQNCSK